MTAKNGHPPIAFPQGHQPVILVADDDLMIRNIVRLLLQACGYRILTASDGEEALLVSRSFPGTIDLTIADLDMPRLNGLDLRTRLLKERSGSKVIVMSGIEVGDTLRQDLKQAFLPKPFDGEALWARVQEALGTPGQCPEAGRSTASASP